MRLQLHWRPLALRIWCARWCLILAWLGLGYFRYPLCAGPGMKKRLPNPLLQPDRMTGTTGNSPRPFPKTIRFKKGTRANSTSRRRIPTSSTSFRSLSTIADTASRGVLDQDTAACEQCALLACALLRCNARTVQTQQRSSQCQCHAMQRREDFIPLLSVVVMRSSYPCSPTRVCSSYLHV